MYSSTVATYIYLESECFACASVDLDFLQQTARLLRHLRPSASRRRASSSSSRRTATSARDHARWPELAADHAGWRAMRCRAARRRRPSVSRPRPRCPIGPLDSPYAYPTPSCAPGVQPAAAARTIRTNAPPTQAPSCIDGRHLAARRGADHAPRGKK